MTPSSELWLLHVPELEPNYANTYLFDKDLSQVRFFKDKVVETLENYTYLRKDNSIKVNKYIDDLYEVNYVMYQNRKGKWYYAFVLDKIYVNEKVTLLTITTDVMQTYMFDYTLAESYVDRCHVDRWVSTPQGTMPTDEFESEGLEFGEYIQDTREEICKLEQKFVAVCSNPLGYMENRVKTNEGGQGGGDDEIECGDWRNGIISNVGFRMIKGFEGYAPKEYYDYIGKVMTIGYGVTLPSEPDAYNYLKSKNGASEEDCAKVSYYLKNERYGKKILKKCIEMGIDKQYQFDALVSFAYNLGPYIFDIPDGKSMVEAITNHKNDEAYMRKTFLKYTNGGLQGLIDRRNAECDLFFNHPQTPRKIPIVKDMDTFLGYVDGDGWLANCDGQASGKYYEAYMDKWYYPTQNKTGTVTSLYGWRIHPITGNRTFHKGIDIGGSLDTPIYSAKAGEVIVAEDEKDGYGLKVIIQHEHDTQTWYCHNNSLKVRKGDKVKTGQEIAGMGKSGNVTGVHLHYEMRTNPYAGGNTRNPIPKAKEGDKI